jgi:peroxiredoxin
VLAILALLFFSRIAVGENKADSLWARLDHAMEIVKMRMALPDDQLRAALLSYDALAKAFRVEFPDDRRRWNLRFFDGVTWESRRKVQLPTTDDPISIMNEVLQAKDADEETRSGASAVRVLALHRELDHGGDSKAWLQTAEEHLKAFPVHPANQRIRALVEQVKSLLAFRGRPLELNFNSKESGALNLADFRGKVVLIDVWESSCPICAADMSAIVKTYAKLHGKGFEILGVSVDKDELEMKKFVAANQMTWPQYFDGQQWDGPLVKKMNVHYTPTMWLVDKTGHLVNTNPRGRLEELVAPLLAK